MTLAYPRGSEWRVWDMHVHSPASHGFKGEWEQFIIQVGTADCDVIGINDYFSVAGYREILRRLNPAEAASGNVTYQAALEKLRSKTLFPVVECRMQNALLQRDKDGKNGPRINFHIIFSNTVNPVEIETLIKGLHYTPDATIGENYNNPEFLGNKVTVDFSKTIEKLQSNTIFKDKFLIWLPYDEYGGVDGIDPNSDQLFKQGLTNASHIIGSSNANQIDFFCWKHNRFTAQQFKDWFGRKKPCIKGSDSHNVNDHIGKLKDKDSQPTNKRCWIKADPTFEGLRQITIEPEDRLYIGEQPAKLQHVTQHRPNFLSRLEIHKKAESGIDDVWFDCDLPLNHDMISIIGNKGSGKSALADILALAGNAHCDIEHYSFLTPSRFCEKNGRISKHFELVAHWEDGTTTKKSLSDHPDPLEVERMKYIPQKYVEKVCTETAPGEQSEFQRELRKVIFSRIPEENRFGKQSLDELIAYKTEEIGKEIDALKLNIRTLNTDLVRLEQKATPEYRQTLEAKIREKKQELEAHNGIKPAEVAKPDAMSDEEKAASLAVATKLDAARTALAENNTAITQAQDRRKEAITKLEQLRKMEVRLNNFSGDFARLKTEISAELTALGISFDDLLKLHTDYTTLNLQKTFWETEKSGLDILLAETGEKSFLVKREEITANITALKGTLNAPNLRHQEYLTALQAWQQRVTAITGDITQVDSLKHFEELLRQLSEVLPQEITRLREQRKTVAMAIYKKIAVIRDVYQELFFAAQQLIQNNPLIKDTFRLSFDSSIVDRGFAQGFFDRFINHGVNGSFCGKEQAIGLVNTLLKDYDFNQPDDTLKFVERIVELLQFDHRSEKRPQYPVDKQVKKNVQVKHLYDFLWSLEYLAPEYALKLDGKELSQLSPGERGTLLLVFYLLVDKSNKPIIVDQPEENLDSHTVFRLLIPVIKEVKKTRQIIMVTHSPNIAVVCDAEQVIHSSIERSAGNRVHYVPGSIESSVSNQFLIDVLEGTRPAFDNREAKYY